MENNETLQQAEKHLEKSQKFFQTMDDKLTQEISEAEMHNFGPEVERLRGEQQAHRDRYARFINSAKDRVEAAKSRKIEAQKVLEDQRKANEDKERNRALRAWNQAGGDLAGFEAAWPEIRKAQLSEATLEKMKNVQSEEYKKFSL